VEPRHNMTARLASRLRLAGTSQRGYVLILAMLILVALGIASAALLTATLRNQQHVSRDRTYTQSLAVAEAGLNQYLWMVASGASSRSNAFGIAGNTGPDSHFQQINLTDIYTDSIQGTYAIKVTPPSASNSNISVTVTGKATSTVDVPRTVTASLGRPSFSQYLLLTNDEVWIGGPLTRVWHGKTFSNTGICVDTANLNETMSSSNATYSSNMFGGSHPGVWSGYQYTVPANDPSRAFWQFPVPAISFATVTSDFVNLSSLAVGNGINLPYSTSTTHDATQGWYIKLLPGRQYQIKRVTAESEITSGSGGSLTMVNPSSPVPTTNLTYPVNGVIYVNDNVWVEGTNLDGRVTIASSGQLNASGKNSATSIHIVGNLTYSHKDGTVAVGLIAQNNVEIPRYAPLGATGTVSQQDMELDAALIAQQGKESCNAADASGGSYGPIRDMLTVYGSVSSFHTPYRSTVSGGNTLGGFVNGTNTYDPWMLHDPPPYFPTVGSYQILDWQELPSAQGVLP
jgi:Tfp pilus assembly protein PilX